MDIYSFGMAALEMAALEIPGNGDTGNVVTQEQVRPQAVRRDSRFSEVLVHGSVILGIKDPCSKVNAFTFIVAKMVGYCTVKYYIILFSRC